MDESPISQEEAKRLSELYPWDIHYHIYAMTDEEYEAFVNQAKAIAANAPPHPMVTAKAIPVRE